jgi:hypothetical protein
VRALALATLVALAACRRPTEAARSARPDDADAFWRCLTASELDGEHIANGQQVRRLVEAAFDREGEAFVARVESRCVPLAPAALKTASLEHVRRMRAWRNEHDDDDDDAERALLADARAWHEALVRSRTSPAPRERVGERALAYDRFLACVVPDLETVRDGDALYEKLSTACFGGDLAAFVEGVRRRCLTSLEAQAPPASFARHRRLRTDEERHVALWAQCFEHAEEQARLEDGAPLAAAVDAWLAARPRD